MRIETEDGYMVLVEERDSDAINELMRERRAEIVKSCGCGDSFTAAEWQALPSLPACEGWPSDMRNCSNCHSTLAMDDGSGS